MAVPDDVGVATQPLQADNCIYRLDASSPISSIISSLPLPDQFIFGSSACPCVPEIG